MTTQIMAVISLLTYQPSATIPVVIMLLFEPLTVLFNSLTNKDEMIKSHIIKGKREIAKG